ncbi:hypothetical protein V4D05_18930 [Vibrio mimicus]|uniref:hypothetical protein n=1 Tax=Vibrio mimicus TaxID=674 RepID=UPI002F92E0DD
MPIRADNYFNFYLGASAEYHVISKIYMHGFEALKYSPDIGFDLHVSNKSQVCFHKEEPFALDLQIKSTFLVDNKAIFFLKKEEVDFLVKQKNCAMIFCNVIADFFKDPESFADYRGCELEYAENNLLSFRNHVYKCQYKNTDIKWPVEYCDIDDFEMSLFWLNSNQLCEAIKRNVLREISADRYILPIFYENNVLFFGDKSDDTEPCRAIQEIKTLKYLLKGCHGSKSLGRGAFLSKYAEYSVG